MGRRALAAYGRVALGIVLSAVAVVLLMEGAGDSPRPPDTRRHSEGGTTPSLRGAANDASGQSPGEQSTVQGEREPSATLHGSLSSLVERARFLLVPVRTGPEAEIGNALAWDLRFPGSPSASGAVQLEGSIAERRFEVYVPGHVVVRHGGDHLWLMVLAPGGRVGTSDFVLPVSGGDVDLGLLASGFMTSVRGRVLTPDGTPVQGAGVWTRRGQIYTWVEDDAVPSCRTDLDGAFTLDLGGRDGSILVHHPGYLAHYTPWIRLSGADVDLGEIRLRRGACVKGTLTVEHDQEQKARIYFTGTAIGETQEFRRWTIEPGEGGAFELRGVPPGSYAIRVEAEGKPPVIHAPHRVRADDKDMGATAFDFHEGVRLTCPALRKGDQLQVEATGQFDQGVSAVKVVLEVGREGIAAWPGLSSDAAWDLQIVGPPRLGGPIVETQQVAIPRGRMVDVAIEFPAAEVRTIVISGQRGAERVPMSGATCSFRIEGTSILAQGVTDERGRITVPAADDATLGVSIEHPETGDLLYWSGPVPADGALVFPSASISLLVSVEDLDGRPVNDLYVRLTTKQVDPTGSTPATVWPSRLGWTDSQGEIRFRHLPLGTYELAYAMGGASTATYGFLPIGTLRARSVPEQAETLRLAGHRARGNAYIDGSPLGSAKVKLMKWVDGAVPENIVQGFAFFTGPAGEWSVDGIPPGRYVLACITGTKKKAGFSQPFVIPASGAIRAELTR